ncbi:MAG: N-acetylmuramoyl-L-alanine amidase [Verrucomicrobiales bacterium]|nr:N-acetylmuramoyl-L-alanine amidase [Verrucomicrobiales bacterium]
MLARLGKKPDWEKLDVYQKTITRLEFQQLLQHNYLQDPQAAGKLIQILPDRVRVSKQSNLAEAGYYDLFFRTSDDEKIPAAPKIHRYWKPVTELRPSLQANRDLSDLHIVIDPGHIGGSFAQIEERWYQIGTKTIPVTEGDMTLKVAKILQQNLSNLGARVTLTRQNTTPVTPARTADLLPYAKKWLTRLPGTRKPSAFKLQHTAERLFYLSSEIRQRAALINETLKPDLLVCLHFNAEAWGNPRKPDFVEKNHNHILINGCYSLAEIKEDDSRLEMLLRLLQRTYYAELAIANEVSDSMRRITKLPPYTYTGNNAKSVNPNPYIWSRNLLANRIYLCPVIFLEPYVMNNRQVHARVQAGSYPGTRKMDRTYRVNLYQEYAHSVTAGLLAYFKKHRK